jgi:hypothetical protein
MGCELVDELQPPVDQLHRLPPGAAVQPGLAAAGGGQVLVVRQFADLLGRVGRAVAEQAVQQEHVEEAQRLGVDADGLERVEVHQAHLDVLHPALAQRVQRALAGKITRLGRMVP